MRDGEERGARHLERRTERARFRRRNVGRLVTVTLADKATLTGRITESDDTRAVLDVDGTSTEVGYADVKKAKIQIEFNRKES